MIYIFFLVCNHILFEKKSSGIYETVGRVVGNSAEKLVYIFFMERDCIMILYAKPLRITQALYDNLHQEMTVDHFKETVE